MACHYVCKKPNKQINGSLKQYEINSIKIIKKYKGEQVPEGKNKENILKPCILKPIMLIAIKTDKLVYIVTIMCPVKVKLNGTKPIIFNPKIKMKRKKLK